MKVLYYNWAPLDTPGVGGGVSVYIKNILIWLKEHPELHEIEPTFLSSGYLFDNRKVPYIREEFSKDGLEIYSLVNSNIVAPHAAAVAQLRKLNNDNVIKEVFRMFLIEKGPFDVIHFQTLEGLAPHVLELREEFPNMRIIYSVHDYGIVCPNVRLWTNTKNNCFINQQHRDCGRCMKDYAIIKPEWVISRRPAIPGQKPIKPSIVIRAYIRIAMILRKYCPLKWFNNQCVSEFRQNNINMINKYVDSVLCVSGRVAEVMAAFGIEKNKLHINYIGTKVAENVEYKLKEDATNDILTLLYMGYAAEEKGFFFYLEMLEQMPAESCSRISLKFASKIRDRKVVNRLNFLKKKFYDVTHYNGYTHADFPAIMKGVNLGIVPPLWEDNLPQVTIEMIANGIPVLTSCYGGAHELNTHPGFVFTSKNDLRDKILDIFNNRNLLNDYWNYSKHLVTFNEHVESLISYYHDRKVVNIH